MQERGIYPELKGKVAVVMGAAGALGGATAARLHAEGVQLVLADRNPLRPSAEHIGIDLAAVESVVGDMTDAKDVDAVIDNAVARFGRIDILVSVTGSFRMAHVVDMDPADWDALLLVNAKSAFLAGRSAARAMTESKTAGRIIFIGARSALVGAAGMAAYTASKAAVLRLTESMALELREGGITVNAVLPGTMDTPANRRAMPTADPAAWVSLESVAGVIAFLASDGARDISGAAIPVSGTG